MAHRVTAVVVDDLDGHSTADDTVHFALDGVNYEIDLSAEHAGRLRECLRPWREHARVVPRGRRRRRTDGRPHQAMSRSDRAHAQAIRTWALANGLQVSARGKIPDAIHRAFDRAHAGA